jgi:heme/copper-type cytochrome/quinol oxidase subunit 1
MGLGWVAAVLVSFMMTEFSLTSHLGGMRLLRRLGSLPPSPVDWTAFFVYASIGACLVIVGAYVSERRSHLEIQ